MSIRKQANGKYLVELYPQGRDGKRVRRTFATKGEATLFENHYLSESKAKPWILEGDDNRRLDELIELWYSLHGQALGAGERRKRDLLAVSKVMENPIGRQITRADFSAYRKKRLKDVSAKTVNNDHAYLNALFTELVRLGEIGYPNPIEGLRQLKYQRPEMGFLTKEQIPLVFNELKNSRNASAYWVAMICISTGCRWSEAEQLTLRQLSPYRITFIKTKGNKNRTVPISEELYNSIPKREGRLFDNCIKCFKMALQRAEIDLPAGQSTHVLRHSFASHFMMKGGNILVLQQILGHSSINDTMKYSHFSPTHLSDAVRFNPMAAG